LDTTGIYLKLDRAKQHFDALNAEIEAYMRRFPARCEAVPIDGIGTYSVRIGQLSPLPRDWGIKVGDCVHNARSSLDHLVWQLVIAAGGTPGRHTEFPICTSPGRWRHEVVETGRRASPLRGVKEEAVEAIRLAQPFIGRSVDDARLATLAGLESLAVADKHRVVHAARSFTQSDAASVHIDDRAWGYEVEFQEFLGDIEIVEGVEVGRIRMRAHPLAIAQQVLATTTLRVTVGFVADEAAPIATMQFIAGALNEVKTLTDHLVSLT